LKPTDASALKAIQKQLAITTSIPRPSIVEEPIKGQEVDTIYDNIQLPGVFMGYRFPEQNHIDYPAIEVLNTILSEGASSRMNKSLVEKKQLAVEAFSFGMDSEDPGLGVVATIASDKVELKTLQDPFSSGAYEVNIINRGYIEAGDFDKVKINLTVFKTEFNAFLETRRELFHDITSADSAAVIETLDLRTPCSGWYHIAQCHPGITNIFWTSEFKSWRTRVSRA
jgi:hypothetical protein